MSKRLRLIPLVALVIALAGCSEFITPPTGVQEHTIGSATLSLNYRNDGFEANFTGEIKKFCAEEPRPTTTEGHAEGQLLIGFLVPAGSGAHEGLSAHLAPAGTVAALTPSSEYAAELAKKRGTPTGKE